MKRKIILLLVVIATGIFLICCSDNVWDGDSPSNSSAERRPERIHFSYNEISNSNNPYTNDGKLFYELLTTEKEEIIVGNIQNENHLNSFLTTQNIGHYHASLTPAQANTLKVFFRNRFRLPTAMADLID
jgi:hypothetical protein